MRLDQFISHYGLFSRKEAGKIIRSGRVSVNEVICKDAGKGVSLHNDIVRLDEVDLKPLPENLTAIFYKPPGYLTAARDKKQSTVMDFIPRAWQKIGVQPVGRLDKDTSGVLLFTTEGHLAHRLLAPKTKCFKNYIFLYRGKKLDEAACKRIASGELVLADGPCLPGKLYFNFDDIREKLQLNTEIIQNIFHIFDKKLEINEETLMQGILSTIGTLHLGALEIHEGRFHQVKRMLLALDREILYLHRHNFAGISLDDLTPGESKILTEDAVLHLKKKVNLME